jgi:hypothetical protein
MKQLIIQAPITGDGIRRVCRGAAAGSRQVKETLVQAAEREGAEPTKGDTG